MANEEHLKILRQGVGAWNFFKKQQDEFRALVGPNLEDARIGRALLNGVNLIETNLMDARLAGTCLDGARLDGAHLDRARLDRVSLVGANLDTAHLAGARLANTCLDNANLLAASLNGTYLDGVSFAAASFGYTTIVDVDLSLSRGLETATHVGPSGIATSTLERTAAGLARDATQQRAVEEFYRGAGVAEDLIELFRTRIGSPNEFYSCFISYSHADKSFARRLHDQLQVRGVRCWLDEHDLKPGDRILDVVNNAIRVHDKILLCCSQASLDSWWVKDEIRKAMERERRAGSDIIIPLMVDRYLLNGWEDGLAADLRSRLAADFTGWEHDYVEFEKQFEGVLKALRF
jgi:TIR domain/Pentapeptide repeats (8 copies)